MKKREKPKLNLKSLLCKDCPIPYAMTVITFMVSTLWFIFTLTFKVEMRLIITIYTFAPFLISLIIMLVYCLTKKRKVAKKIIEFLSIILVVMIIIWYHIVIIGTGLFYALTPRTDIKDYENIVTGELLTVFPEKIPEDVQNVSFMDQTGFLQGGSYTTLYYIDPNLDVTEFDNKYRVNAIWIGNEKDYTENPELLTGAFLGSPAEYENEEDFTLYLFKARCDDSGYCNHGESLLVGVNPKTNEVIYSYGNW